MHRLIHGHLQAIMGAADLAAGVSAVAVSSWTNTSYKKPLLSGALASVVGNALFCTSYSLRSLPLLLAARVMTGLGSARAANRRYTAGQVRPAAVRASSPSFP